MTLRTSISFTRLTSAAIIGLCFSEFNSAFLISPAFAQTSEGRQFSPAAGEIVNAALALINDNQHSAALTKLDEALSLPDLNAYEHGTIYQMQGTSYYELGQYGPAVSAFENAIRSGGLLANEADSLRVNIAQLLIANGQYAEGAERPESYLKRGGQEKPQYVEMLAQAWVQSGHYSRALPWAEKWFNDANPKERKHFDLLNFIYHNLGQAGPQADIVKQMINRWPEDRTLWDAWISLLIQSGQEEEAFEVNVMLNQRGALTREDELLKLVQYYSYYGIPYQAANILEQEMNAGRVNETPETLEQLSNLFRQAREYKRAIPILEKAALQSGEGKLYADLGEALYNEGECARAETAFMEAINRGFDTGKAWMLIGTCRYESSQKEKRPVCKTTTKEGRKTAPRAIKRASAVQAFNNVPSASREGRNAKKWVSFIQAEGQAVEDRCQFEINVERDWCFIQIRHAYDATVFQGGFKLEDQKCAKFKDEYDSIYRVKVGEADC